MNIEKIPVNSLVRIYFKEHDRRGVMIGKFVNLHDAEMLRKKGMIRWLPYSQFEVWNPETSPVAFTKIFVASDFTQVKLA